MAIPFFSGAVLAAAVFSGVTSGRSGPVAVPGMMKLS
jgi:hypothetical protein